MAVDARPLVLGPLDRAVAAAAPDPESRPPQHTAAPASSPHPPVPGSGPHSPTPGSGPHPPVPGSGPHPPTPSPASGRGGDRPDVPVRYGTDAVYGQRESPARIAEPTGEYATSAAAANRDAANADKASDCPPLSRQRHDDTQQLPLSRKRERGLGGEGRPATPGGEGRPATPDVKGSTDVAARLLADVLALDLGNLTPIKALTLLHEMQVAARKAVPWNTWVAGLAGAQPQAGPGAQPADADQ